MERQPDDRLAVHFFRPAFKFQNGITDNVVVAIMLDMIDGVNVIPVGRDPMFIQFHLERAFRQIPERVQAVRVA